jgi:non-ribosomal peptide synthetase component F
MDKGFRASQTYDLSFDLSVADMFFTFSNHGTLCVLSEKELLFPIDYIIRENIEYWSSVPTLIAFMHKMGVLKPNAFPSIKKSIFCGEPMPRYLADAWKIAAPNSSIENLYGPTEATIWLTRYVYEGQDDTEKFINNNLPIGSPFEDHDVKLIDSDDNIVEDCNRGEIVYRGPQITLGYLNDKAKTDAAFTKFKWDPKQSIWYKSGDIGCFNLNGSLECLGRKDNQIKLGGRRIEIAEIELSLRSFRLLEDLVVVPLKDEDNRVLELVGFTMNALSAEELKAIKLKSLDNLEAIFFPKRVFEIERFPVNTSGKLDRKSLVEMAKTLGGRS